MKWLILPLLLTATLGSTQELYQTKPATRDGIGKIYFGREISHVMGHLGAGWLERPSREQEERTDLLLNALPLEPGDTVVDLGAGTGYFSFPIAQRLDVGEVLAVDIQQEMLDIIMARAAESGIDNVQTVLATPTSPGLGDAEVDLVLMVDAYHEFSHPAEVMAEVAQAWDLLVSNHILSLFCLVTH